MLNRHSTHAHAILVRIMCAALPINVARLLLHGIFHNARTVVVVSFTNCITCAWEKLQIAIRNVPGELHPWLSLSSFDHILHCATADQARVIDTPSDESAPVSERQVILK